jgi:tetratricopeptide (TPR) repeat protein
MSKLGFAIVIGIMITAPTIVNSALAADAPKPTWSQEITECDRQASHGDDPWHVAPPREKKDINFDTAIPACLEALKKDPENPRLNYQMGRLHGYSGQWQKGMPYRLKAVEAKYPQSLFVIGWLYLSGDTIDKKDPCKTVAMWRESAKLNRLAAQVGLPHYYKLGAFKECGVDIPASEMLEYLDAASKQTKGDFYTNLLIAELQADLKK